MFVDFRFLAVTPSPSNRSVWWSLWVDRFGGRNCIQQALPHRIAHFRTSSTISAASTLLDHYNNDNFGATRFPQTNSAMLPSTTATTSKPLATFYRRELPQNTCVALSSPQGRAYFESALKSSHLKSFFPLIEQFTTQSDPAYCGVSTLVMVLNALSVDPRKVWKGPWRWYEESMLNCCIDLEQVKSTGITLPQFICLASCQGLEVQRHLVPTSAETDNQSDESLDEFRKAVHVACRESRDEESSVDSKDLKSESAEPLSILVVSYSRKVVGQTGDGHFSPVGAYDPVSDSVLILDTARFKYGPHWVKLRLLWEAMQPVDPATGRPRGFVLLSFPGDEEEQLEDASDLVRHVVRPPQSLLFRSRMADYQLRRQYHDYLQSFHKNTDESDPDPEVTWEQVLSYWTKNGTDFKYVWQILQPQLTPLDPVERDAVTELRSVLNDVMRPYQTELDSDCHPESVFHGKNCRSNLSRTMCLTPQEAMFVVYLASLQSEQRRRDIVYSVEVGNTATEDELNRFQAAREQLLSEAALIRLALDVSEPSL